MTASFDGRVDIVRLLVEAKAQLDTQAEVLLLLPPENNTSTQHHIYIYIYTCTVLHYHCIY